MIMKKLVGIKSIKKILSTIDKALNTHSEVIYNDEETVYVNTFLDSVNWQQLIDLSKKGVDIEAVNTDEEAEGFVVLMIDLRSDLEKENSDQKEIDEDLDKFFMSFFENNEVSK